MADKQANAPYSWHYDNNYNTPRYLSQVDSCGHTCWVASLKSWLLWHQLEASSGGLLCGLKWQPQLGSANASLSHQGRSEVPTNLPSTSKQGWDISPVQVQTGQQ